MEKPNPLKLILESLNLSNWKTKQEGNKILIAKGAFSTELYLNYLDQSRIHFVRFEEQVNQTNLDPEDIICVRIKHDQPCMTEIITFLREEYSLYDRIIAA